MTRISAKFQCLLVLMFSFLICAMNASERPELTTDNDESDPAITVDASNVNTIDTDNDNNLHNDDDNEAQEPPSHFRVTAHVQTNLHTGHSYFLPTTSLPASFAHLPFLECGAVGATTEGVPLVSGVFRHVPHSPSEGVVRTERREELAMAWDRTKEGGDARNGDAKWIDARSTGDLGSDMLDAEEGNNNSESNGSNSSENIANGAHPERPSPPKYVVALSSMQITVGGKDGIHNETQQFEAGDVVFIEDTWRGVWDDFDDDVNLDANERETSMPRPQEDGAAAGSTPEMKGYVMRASPDSQKDLEVLMVTVPASVHRHWHRAAAAANRAKRKRRQLASQSTSATRKARQNGFGTLRPWWKRSKRPDLPGPCALADPDPAFANPSMVSPTLSQHLAQHFTKRFRRSSDSHRSSFLPNHHQDPMLIPASSAVVGGVVSFALWIRFLKTKPRPIDNPSLLDRILKIIPSSDDDYSMPRQISKLVVVGVTTYAFVSLGEAILEQWKLWKEKRTLEKMMKENWDRGESGA